MEDKTLFDKEFDSVMESYVMEGSFTSLIELLGLWTFIMGLVFLPFNSVITIGSFAAGTVLKLIHSKIGKIGREKVRKLFANEIIRKYCLEQWEDTRKELEVRYSKRAHKKIKLYNRPGKGNVDDSGDQRPFGSYAYKNEDELIDNQNMNVKNSNFTEVITIKDRDFYVFYDSDKIAGVAAEYWWYDDSYGVDETDNPDDYMINSWKYFSYTLKYPSKEILKELWDSKVGKGE